MRRPIQSSLSKSTLATWCLSFLLCLVAVPGFAYTVILKDGTRIDTQEKYRIEGDKAILVLVNGTEASFDASEIDVAKTEEFNKVDYGTATLIEGRESRQLATDEMLNDEETLSDLLGRGEARLALPEPIKRREPGERAESETEEVPRTKAGFVDLFAMPRDPYPNTTVVTEVMRYLKGQGIDNVRVYKGSQGDRPLLEIVATSEASVFKALKDSANSLVQINERFPDVAAYELLLLTDEQVRAGQFTLTPEQARLLVTERIQPPNFFLRYVEF